ncbi:hypothetical protein BGZ63DRAFT_394367 [Mariannaea sp. PMI_226]|nr:hypothetical protein BGZ63DRAFT_394367 [Mariannaea sp. PMI_226]
MFGEWQGKASQGRARQGPGKALCLLDFTCRTVSGICQSKSSRANEEDQLGFPAFLCTGSPRSFWPGWKHPVWWRLENNRSGEHLNIKGRSPSSMRRLAGSLTVCQRRTSYAAVTHRTGEDEFGDVALLVPVTRLGFLQCQPLHPQGPTMLLASGRRVVEERNPIYWMI